MHGGQGASKWKTSVQGALPSSGWPGAHVSKGEGGLCSSNQRLGVTAWLSSRGTKIIHKGVTARIVSQDRRKITDWLLAGISTLSTKAILFLSASAITASKFRTPQLLFCWRKD